MSGGSLALLKRFTWRVFHQWFKGAVNEEPVRRVRCSQMGTQRLRIEVISLAAFQRLEGRC